MFSSVLVFMRVHPPEETLAGEGGAEYRPRHVSYTSLKVEFYISRVGEFNITATSN